MEVGISKYNGVKYKTMNGTDGEEFEAILLSGKEGQCEGCQDDKKLMWHGGLWLCGVCIIHDLENSILDEKLRVDISEEIDGIITQVH